MTSIIQKLSPELINQIAAGEVIENPASVVKELVENAIDAKSTSIEVRIFGGGLQSIIISDNGVGMTKEDAELCFEKHATSKMQKFDDLWALSTMGFRGEALAAISSISKVTLTTSLATPHATKVVVHGGKIISIESASRQKGTTIEVNELFYNTPARKAFQKNSSSSFSQIYKLLEQFSLAYPQIEFTLYQAAERALLLPASLEQTSLLKQLEDKGSLLFQEKIDEEFVPLEIHKEHYKITGWLGKPEIAKHNRTYQHLFINQRAVQCAFIQAILKQAYGTLIDGKKYPVCILHLQVDPAMIDINVHPQKKEIRFREDWKLQRSLFEDFESALFGPVKATSFTQTPSNSPLAYKAYHPPAWQESYSDPFFAEKKKPQEKDLSPWEKIEQDSSFTPSTPSFSSSYKEPDLLNQEDLPIGKIYKINAIGLFDTYLLLHTEGSELPLGITLDLGILFIDLKQLYEKKTLSSLRNKYPPMQKLLLPISVSLSSFVEESLLQKLEEFGFLARILGKNSVALEAVPESISLEVARELFVFLFENIQENNSISSIEQKLLKAYDGKLTSAKRFSMAEALSLWEWALALPKNEGSQLWKKAISFASKKALETPMENRGEKSFERVF